MKACMLCENRDWVHGASSPVCSFSYDVFSPDGWCCATAKLIRKICKLDNTLVDFQTFEGQSYASINISNVKDETIGYCLWVTWYKNRGRTENMVVLGEFNPRSPTESQCLDIIEYFKTCKEYGETLDAV